MDSTPKALPHSDIPSVIQRASLFGGKIFQPTPTKNLSCDITDITLEDDIVTIRLTDPIELETVRPISVKLNYRDMTFLIESKTYSVKDNTITTCIPQEARALSLRFSERYVLPLNEEVHTHFHRAEKRGSTLDVNARVIDVSKTGLGILISDIQEADILRENDHIWIRSLNGVKLSTPLFGKIVYVFERKFKDTKDLKAGVSLETRIPESVMDHIQQLCKLVLRA